MNETLNKIYQSHHASRRRGGFAVLEKERGELFTKFLGKNKRILDIGCRDGVITKYFLPGNIVIGVDIDSVILEEAKKNLNIDTFNLDLQQEWPFEQSRFARLHTVSGFLQGTEREDLGPAAIQHDETLQDS